MIIVLSSLGGIVSFVTCCYFVVRAIVRGIGALRENTHAVSRMSVKIESMGNMVNQHTIDIAVLQDRARRR